MQSLLPSLPYFKLRVCSDRAPSEKIDCTSAEIRSPSWKNDFIISSSSEVLRLSSPPGRLIDDRSRIESRREFVSIFHRFCETCTSITRPTTMSPISPLYRVRSGFTEISLLIGSTKPATVATSFSLCTYVPWPRMKPGFSGRRRLVGRNKNWNAISTLCESWSSLWDFNWD